MLPLSTPARQVGRAFSGSSAHPSRSPVPTLRLLLGELEFGVVDAVLDEDGEIWGHLTKKLAEEARLGVFSSPSNPLSLPGHTVPHPH